MNQVKIYKITVEQAYSIWDVGNGFSLEKWGNDTLYYKGRDDGGEDYLLPDGFTVGIDGFDCKRIYDSKNSYCELVTIKDRPAIATADGVLFLEKVVQNG